MPSDASFQSELQRALEARLEPEAAQVLAHLLAEAYHSDPRRRPADIAVWTDEVAHALQRAAFTIV
jgi:hypothetical protein